MLASMMLRVVVVPPLLEGWNMFNGGDDHGFNYKLLNKMLGIDITNAEASVGNRCYLVLPRSLVSRRTPST